MAEDRDSLLRLITKLYYMDNLEQSQIAEMVGISRSQISRMLKKAREKGIVRITVDEYSHRDNVLENELKCIFPLNNVFVIKVIKNLNPDAIRKEVGYFGAPLISELIISNIVIGVAGGRSISELVNCMNPVAGAQGITVVQLMGNIGPQISNIDAIELSHKLARKYSGSVFTLNAPAHVQDPKSRDVFLNHEHMLAIWELYEVMQIALVGIGSLSNSSFIERGMLNFQDIQMLKQNCAVGEICGRFYNENGEECSTEYRDRVISIGLHELQRTPEVIGIVSPGHDKVQAVYTAAKNKLIKSLLIDDIGAAELIKLAEKIA